MCMSSIEIGGCVIYQNLTTHESRFLSVILASFTFISPEILLTLAVETAEVLQRALTVAVAGVLA